MKPVKLYPLCLFLLAFLPGCTADPVTDETYYDKSREKYERTGGSLLGTGLEGNSLFGRDEKKPKNSGSGIGVNAFLWRATLDSLSFMPFSSADPFGGVIITDWYSGPDVPNERFKVNAFILGRDLRSDGVHITVFKQRLTPAGWIDAKVAEDTAEELEKAVLTRAREIRIAAVSE